MAPTFGPPGFRPNSQLVSPVVSCSVLVVWDVLDSTEVHTEKCVQTTDTEEGVVTVQSGEHAVIAEAPTVGAKPHVATLEVNADAEFDPKSQGIGICGRQGTILGKVPLQTQTRS